MSKFFGRRCRSGAVKNVGEDDWYSETVETELPQADTDPPPRVTFDVVLKPRTFLVQTEGARPGRTRLGETVRPSDNAETTRSATKESAGTTGTAGTAGTAGTDTTPLPIAPRRTGPTSEILTPRTAAEMLTPRRHVSRTKRRAASGDVHPAHPEGDVDPDQDNDQFKGFTLLGGPSEFVASVVKGSELDGLAMDVDSADGFTLLVKEVKAGPILTWNREMEHKGLDIRTYDRVIEVNGVRGDAADLMKVIKSSRKVELLVRRPTAFRLCVEKRTSIDSIGAAVDASDGKTLLIAGVRQSGLLHEWNKAHWEKPVRKNDRIIEVNGIRGCAERLLDLIKTEDRLELLIEH